MSQISLNTTSSVTSADLGPSSSLQLMFAKLQLELSETAKSQALERMDYISKQQEEQKLVSSMLNEARQLQADAANESDANKAASGEKDSTMMPVEMEDRKSTRLNSSHSCLSRMPAGGGTDFLSAW